MINPFAFTAAQAFWAGLTYSAIGSAIGTVVNGGTFQSFAVGMAVGLVAGCIASAIGGAMGSTWSTFAEKMVLGAQFVAGAVTGAIAGGISSAIYGQNIGRELLEGAKGGAIGAGVGMAYSGFIGGDSLSASASNSGLNILVTLGKIIHGIGSVLRDLINIIKVDVEGFRVGILDAGTVRNAFTNLKAKDPRMELFLKDFKGKGLTIKLFDEQNGYYSPDNNTISWNPKFDDFGTPDAFSKVNPDIVLGHEMIHAHHFLVEGALSGQDRYYYESRSVGLGQWAGSNNITENTLRDSYRVTEPDRNKPRTSYYSGGFPF